MPSPLAHTAAGYLIGKTILSRQEKTTNVTKKRKLLILSASVLFSMLPDLDSVIGLITGDFGRYHNNITHSLFFGLGISVLIGLFTKFLINKGFWLAFAIAILGYETHIVMDYFTYGRGVMALWPLTSERFHASFFLFYGLHWSDGLISIKHGLTLVSESAFILLTWLLFRWILRKKPVESEA